MACFRCKAYHIADIPVNRCIIEINGLSKHVGHIPTDGIGSGDYVKICICLDCGQIQGNWPMFPKSEMEDS
jgi:hypothetical protein